MQKLIVPALKQLEQRITKDLTPEQMKIYDGMVKDGMKLLYDKKMRKQSLAGLSGDKPELKAAIVAVGVVKMLMDRAQWPRVDRKAQQAGGLGILINLLDFLQIIGAIKVSPESLKRAVSTVQMLWRKGVTPPNGARQQQAQQMPQQPGPQMQQQGLIGGAIA